MSWRKPGILIPNLYLYSIKMQTNIDQNEVKNLWKITYFLKKKFRAGPSSAHVAGLDPVGFLPTSVREQFTHACYSRDVINLPVHSVCAFSAKLEKFTWKQDEGNNSFGPLSSPFRLFFFWFLWFFLFFSVSVFRSSYGSFPFIFVFSFLPVFFVFFVPFPFSVSLLPILCFLTLSLCLSLFLFFSKDFPPSVSFSLCCPVLLPSRSFFYVFSLLPSSPPPAWSLLWLL